jgi:prepilin-type N-terminal cleavage/methylation domain-containing protein
MRTVKQTDNQTGFTLVEILVAIVISVISVSAIISSYQYFNKTNKLVSQNKYFYMKYGGILNVQMC